MKNHNSAWLIIAQTNLHVGNENLTNYGVIDQAIQRDVTTEIPCINSSSLKGAIKEYIANKVTEISCKEVFGSENASNDSSVQKGNTIFFDASLLYLPIQCTDETDCLFKLGYQQEVLEAFIKRLTMLNVKGNTKEDIANIVTNHIPVPFINTNLKEISKDENLPIIARNKLDNGESDNLWYEQVLPSMSVLGTLICTNDERLETALDNALIQIGANATIGYGYCKFIKLNKSEHHE